MVGTCAKLGVRWEAMVWRKRAGWRAVVVCAWARGRARAGGWRQRRVRRRGGARRLVGDADAVSRRSKLRTGSVWEERGGEEGGEGEGRGVPVDRQHFERVECDEDLARVGVDISLNVALLGVVEDTGFVQMDQGTVVRRDLALRVRAKNISRAVVECALGAVGAPDSQARAPLLDIRDAAEDEGGGVDVLPFASQPDSVGNLHDGLRDGGREVEHGGPRDGEGVEEEGGRGVGGDVAAVAPWEEAPLRARRQVRGRERCGWTAAGRGRRWRACNICAGPVDAASRWVCFARRVWTRAHGKPANLRRRWVGGRRRERWRVGREGSFVRARGLWL